ncbi:nitrate reductase [Roseovarius faecimaris]|uniref:Chaperone NapD n=1 Tax=Roseovarius faecimaris TaxID=2494550 RepID=A0A6I6IJ72_9RHOB|nr:chaperone NapD [Roseovarius faecimaris]QGX96990.1 nitrate reductase [Roseovarius faecimaris]
MNICGCLIHIAPGQEAVARAAMETTPGVEIHAESEDGRFVIVVEDTEEKFASETIVALHKLPGMLSITLSFHHFEERADDPVRPIPQHPQTARGLTHDRI